MLCKTLVFLIFLYFFFCRFVFKNDAWWHRTARLTLSSITALLFLSFYRLCNLETGSSLPPVSCLSNSASLILDWSHSVTRQTTRNFRHSTTTVVLFATKIKPSFLGDKKLPASLTPCCWGGRGGDEEEEKRFLVLGWTYTCVCRLLIISGNFFIQAFETSCFESNASERGLLYTLFWQTSYSETGTLRARVRSHRYNCWTQNEGEGGREGNTI